MVFLRALRVGGVRIDIRRWAKKRFRCPECDIVKKEKPKRPGMIPKDICL